MIHLMRSGGAGSGLAARVLAFLRQRRQPASSRLIAEMFLRMSPPSEQVATRLLHSSLRPAGLTYQEGLGWCPPEPGRDAEVEAEPAPRMAAAVMGPGRGRVCLAEVTAEGPRSPAGLDAINLAGATVVMMEPRRDGASLSRALRERGLPSPDRIVSLRSVVRDGFGLPRGADLATICARLGIRWMEGEDAASLASAIASCVVAARARRDSTPIEGGDEAKSPAAWITPERLATIPRAPGVYRFYDQSGGLLYVGKAADLRRRLESYVSRSRPAGHGSRFLSRAARVEHEVTGSELEALLKEARLIRRRRPEGNVQLHVHERPGRVAAYGAARSFALLLPRSGLKGVTVLVVREGRYAGHAVVGPKGGGLRAATRLLSPGRTTSARGHRAARSVDRDTQILNSWMAVNAERVSRLDLD